MQGRGSTALRLAAFAAAAASPAVAPGERLVFAPRAAVDVTKHFERVLKLSCTELIAEWTWDGLPKQEPMREPQAALEVRETLRGSLTDVYRESNEDRWERSFGAWTVARALAGRADLYGTCSGEWEGQSALEGTRIEFSRNGDVWEARAANPKFLERELLDGLRPDVELRGLLPGRSVEVGAEWIADSGTMAGLVGFGGFLDLRDSRGRALGGFLLDPVLVGFEDEPRIRFVRVEDLGPDRVAVLAISGKLRAHSSPRQRVCRLEYPFFGVGPGTETDSEVLELEVRGEVVFDLERGYVRSLDVDSEAVLIQSRLDHFDERNTELRTSFPWRGTLSVHLCSD